MCRDFGIFTTDTGTVKGLFAYVPYPKTHVFGQAPGRFYVLDDQSFIRQMQEQFNRVWNDRGLQIESEAALRALLDGDNGGGAGA
jgi:hypothetical protein